MKSNITIAMTWGALVLLAPINGYAERADRDKPVNLEADKVTVDDRQQLHVYEGNVVLTQGSLTIKASKLHVKQDALGYQRGIALSGAKGVASFSQKREGRNDFVEGEAERIEHDTRSEKTEFFNRAHVKSGLDEVSGQYIVYDLKTENYVVTSGPNGSNAAPGSGERVRVTIQSRNPNAAPVGTTVIPSKEPKQ
jgi:lipopolysaccharide export system protein LptA